MSVDPQEGLLASVSDLDDVVQAQLLADFLPTRQLEFSANVPAGEQVENVRTMPFPGFVREVFVRFPDGVAGRVGVKVRSETQGDAVLPANDEDEFISLNSVQRGFTVVFREEELNEITVTYDSLSGKDHFINVIIEVVDTQQIEGVL